MNTGVIARRFGAACFAAALFFAPFAAAADDDSAQPPFPELSGPVVDGAGILPADTKDALTRKLTAYDQDSGNQLVVVTVQSLDGYPLDEWGYKLGRYWGIGRKDANTGALLLVDYGEHKVRIEAGYGLEGTLTDALSDDIIRNTIVPKFKQNDYAGGISDGVDAILAVLGGQAEEVHKQKRQDGYSTFIIILFVVGILFRILMASYFMRRGSGLFGLWWLLGGFGGGWGSGRGSGGFGGGGGFSGGGGSFGGGGASGSW